MRYGTLGYPVKHSLSPVVHNAAFKALGMDAQYGVFEIELVELADFMDRVRHEPIAGLSVTAPYKRDVMPFLDQIHEDARRIGAVNTVKNQGGFLHGYNVDYIGVVKALLEVVGSLSGRRVTVLGAGGAARAAVYGLLKEGAVVSIYNRSQSKAAELAGEFGEMFGVGIGSGGLKDVVSGADRAGGGGGSAGGAGGSADRAGGDILVQASSIWLVDEGAVLEDLISREVLAGFEVVMDIVYKPMHTPLIEDAARLGKKTVTGDKMFLFQAMEQFKLWTGKEAPAAVMAEALNGVL